MQFWLRQFASALLECSCVDFEDMEKITAGRSPPPVEAYYDLRNQNRVAVGIDIVRTYTNITVNIIHGVEANVGYQR